MSSRRMIYPYTFTAKWAQFPFKFYYENNRYFKCFIWGYILSLPFFWKMQQLTCSEANYLKLEEYWAKERQEVEEHKHHML